ncbi:hypothetical protein BDV33DRAFT_185133 [Aspergillus novoparasiticus]|uniref:Uncharacterized protein n=1 Tax=Aspergillus novoparasiticus TaxID=986946 RepID=A0A5N6E6Q7_9EURO|nr:hypothetical protein BDV33DRAFT_185133 [Aspergillus novoparasiticus]
MSPSPPPPSVSPLGLSPLGPPLSPLLPLLGLPLPPLLSPLGLPPLGLPLSPLLPPLLPPLGLPLPPLPPLPAEPLRLLMSLKNTSAPYCRSLVRSLLLPDDIVDNTPARRPIAPPLWRGNF